jgi:tetratricopeptide (TPR) repeat protein
MSAELTKARQKINSINSHLKQGKHLPAVQALYEAVQIIAKTSLIRSEREEFAKLMDNAVFLLSKDRELARAYPLAITYEPGKEREMLESLHMILQEMQHSKGEEAQEYLEDIKKQRAKLLKEAQAFLQEGELAKAKRIFDRLLGLSPDDIELMAEIADMFLAEEFYQDAFEYLEKALKEDPAAIHIYNRIAIVLRRMRDYDTAERYLRQALDIVKDANLYFNLGRVYVDWRKWKKAKLMAEKAIALNPDFEEARKMYTYVDKKMGTA